MKYLFLLFLPTLVLGSEIPPTPFPVFLKAGFSSVLEFEEVPVRVVIGDLQSFQVEKLERSLVVKTLVSYATSNMFVYFKNGVPRLFVLNASEDAQTTYYKKFESPIIPKREPLTGTNGLVLGRFVRGTRIIQSHFDDKKDYLTVETEFTSDSSGIIKPNWNLVRLMSNGRAIVPFKLWAERKDVQKDSKVKARFIFAKPNIPRNLEGVSLVVPLIGDSKTISRALKGGKL